MQPTRIKYKFLDDYYVSTVVLNTATICKYIREQQKQYQIKDK